MARARFAPALFWRPPAPSNPNARAFVAPSSALKSKRPRFCDAHLIAVSLVPSFSYSLFLFSLSSGWATRKDGEERKKKNLSIARFLFFSGNRWMAENEINYEKSIF